MICNNCNHKLPDDSEFCQYCGRKITGAPVLEFSEQAPAPMETVSKKIPVVSHPEAGKKPCSAENYTNPQGKADPNFGLVPQKPIYTSENHKKYLSKLRTVGGEKITWRYNSSVDVAGIGGSVYVYDIYLLSGQKYATIYINTCSEKASAETPRGFAPGKAKGTKMNVAHIVILSWLVVNGAFGCVVFYLNARDSYDLMAASCCFVIFFFGVIAEVLKILGTVRFKSNLYVHLFTVCSLLPVLFCCMIGAGVISLVLALFVFICELQRFISLCLVKYHSSQSYRMKCYQRINVINEYREKGVITQEEFEDARKRIVEKMR